MARPSAMWVASCILTDYELRREGRSEGAGTSSSAARVERA